MTMTVEEALEYYAYRMDSAFEEFLSTEFPSGDCESVQRQWEKSFAREELVDEIAPVQVLAAEVHRLRAENEGLRSEKDDAIRSLTFELAQERKRLYALKHCGSFSFELVIDREHDGEYELSVYTHDDPFYGDSLESCIDALIAAEAAGGVR